MKRNLLIICIVLLTLNLSAQCRKPNLSLFFDFSIEYTTAKKVISIIDDSIIVREWVEEYGNPVSNVPSSRREIIKKAVLSEAALSELKTVVKSSGFMNLSKSEYGSNPKEPCYPYTIEVTTKKKYKKVLYRSNSDPKTQKAPEAFDILEKKLNEIVMSIKDWK